MRTLYILSDNSGICSNDLHPEMSKYCNPVKFSSPVRLVRSSVSRMAKCSKDFMGEKSDRFLNCIPRYPDTLRISVL
ncbi:hypothetical protein MLD38_021765 [Melastoma candidum]|uniref:Uncharacterized protein n=1 Tax=Melastoma candidum TaxID=119954 RepID=A0ACB9QKI6_9MYRT|nr:hypothetical protein MLD38_021765 [Melastoma candidum]